VTGPVTLPRKVMGVGSSTVGDLAHILTGLNCEAAQPPARLRVQIALPAILWVQTGNITPSVTAIVMMTS
jgi:hypothetical protein